MPEDDRYPPMPVDLHGRTSRHAQGLVDQLYEQRLQIEYDGQRVKLRPASQVVKTMEPAHRSVQSILALEWCDVTKAVEI
jgi:hypothetical protein